MGCRCCKMIQSYLFDPVQVPSPGYINEVNSCKLEEDENVKFKGRTSSQALVPKTEHPSEGLKRTASRAAAAPTRGDPGEGHGADKTWGSSNGVGPAPALQPAADVGGPQDDRGSWASVENGVHPSQPFLEGQDVGGQDAGPAAWEGSPDTLNGDCPALPAPDYPAPGEKDHLCPAEDGHPQPASMEPGGPPAETPQARRDSCEALSTDGLSLCWKDGDPAPPAAPLVDLGDTWAQASGDPSAPEADEDAAVAEALAALEAATAGEEVDEAE
ncbi:uncharacterized protein C4orf19 homolog [Sorex fumeus]|uniref:uncharacterized protein C4orf19 homolog n=1 Tax=Sorex fumeus TaxID=62283 RepID=UPI0024AE5234|nr:uncharacterized protein C4orf19 homolog [Sorex fumeus]